jgi:hypothetical protein
VPLLLFRLKLNSVFGQSTKMYASWGIPPVVPIRASSMDVSELGENIDQYPDTAGSDGQGCGPACDDAGTIKPAIVTIVSRLRIELLLWEGLYCLTMVAYSRGN